ncbi:hypothetical protein STEG23_024313 [Scotinomys teguina]
MAGTFQEKSLFIFSDTDMALLIQAPEDTRTHRLIISSRKTLEKKLWEEGEGTLSGDTCIAHCEGHSPVTDQELQLAAPTEYGKNVTHSTQPVWKRSDFHKRFPLNMCQFHTRLRSEYHKSI